MLHLKTILIYFHYMMIVLQMIQLNILRKLNHQKILKLQVLPEQMAKQQFHILLHMLCTDLKKIVHLLEL